jgi:hypothetical protein
VTSYSTDLYLTASHRRIIWSITSSQLSAQRRPVHRFISVSERTTHPTHGLPHPTQGHTMFHLRLREEPHTHLMGTPNSWASSPHTGAHNVPSPSQRGTTHPSHGHTQLMGFLTGRLTQSVSWRMSHAAVIINPNGHELLNKVMSHDRIKQRRISRSNRATSRLKIKQSSVAKQGRG